MVHIDGKTFLMRNNLGAAEKTALKDQVGTVIDRMMYGNNAGWLSWLDWWSVGPMLLIGDIIFTEMTDENYSFIDDVLKQAMIDLGFLTLPEYNFVDSETKDPVKHYETPPATKDTTKNLNYSGVFTSAQASGSNASNIVIVPTKTPSAPYITYVVEVVPNGSVSSLTPSDTTFLRQQFSNTGVALQPFGEFDSYSPYVYRNAGLGISGNVKVYRGSDLIFNGPTVNKSGAVNVIPISHLKKMNRQVYSLDMSSGTKTVSTLILQSTVDSSIPIYKLVTERSSLLNKTTERIGSVGLGITASDELKAVGYKVYWDFFTDRVITPPSPRPAPDLKEVKADNPKDYVSSPVINKDPKTGKPTMAIPVTAIVQDPVQNPVKPDPNGGIIISKPDGTPVTDPETELPPVTNNPEVVTNPTTGEPEIKPTPNSPPQPAIPPANTPEPTPDPPTTEDPDTGDPDTGDPDTDSPPTDPDDEDPGKVRWDKLKDIPNFMTTRFPFSLPWDIARFLDAVFPDVTPISELVFEFPDIGSYDTSFEIRIPEYFEPWMDFARAAFIYGFDISLVYAIYRLFGGAE
ncbi:hypothetical protein JFT70_14050 [Bacillus sp. TH11]|nr:hypothetical protein [Bacillus sp. TH11]